MVVGRWLEGEEENRNIRVRFAQVIIKFMDFIRHYSMEKRQFTTAHDN